MNKTIDVSLAGMLFHLEESAYYKIKKYLKHVQNSLDSNDTEEIMNEIEARIAELLSQKINNPQQVIDKKNIDEIIEIIGKPEDFELETESNNKRYETKISKKLFRDIDKKIIGGVAAGFAHYLGMDITYMRIIFLILLIFSSGSFILLYILLWIIIPKAVTASDKLKMKGEKVNIDNIVEQVSTDDTDKKKIKSSEYIENSGAEIGNSIARIFGFLIAFISGSILLTLIISMLSLSTFSDFHFVVDDIAFFNSTGMPFMWFNILSHIIIGIPFVFLFLIGIKLLFPNTKKLPPNFYWVIGTIWLISLVVLTVKSISVLSHKSESALIEDFFPLKVEKDTLNLDIISNDFFTDKKYKSKNRIPINFKPSNDSLFHIKISKRAEGLTKENAKENANKIRYDYKLDTIKNSLSINTNIYYPKKDAIVEHYTHFTIQIPKNKAVKMLSDISQYNYKYNCNFGDIIVNNNGILECNGKISNDNEGIRISNDNVNISVDNNGIKIKAKDQDGKKAEISIDENGVKIKKQ